MSQTVPPKAPPDALPPVFRPGDARLDTSAIPSYTNTWRVTNVGPDGAEELLGNWEDRVEYEDRAGRRVLRRIQRSIRTTGAVGTHLDEVDAKTLFPLRVTQTYEGWPSVDLSYEGNRMTGQDVWRPVGAGEDVPLLVKVSLEFPEPTFEWHLWGVLLSSFPLADGFSARFVAHSAGDPDASRLRMIQFHVTGRETVSSGAAGPVECYVVEVDDSEAWTLWISTTRRPRPVLQLKIIGRHGTRWFKP